MPTRKTKPAASGLGVDRKNDSWSFTAVPMSVSAHNRDRDHRTGENPPVREGKSADGKAHPGGDGGGSRPVRPPGGEPTDEQLLTEYRQGDKTSFPKLMARYQRELYHFLVRFLGDRAAAEDVFQETFLQVHQSAGQFDLQRRFRPWLFTIAANKARDLIRSQARRPTNPLQASISAGDDDSGEFIDLMSAA